jgi:hypothetical protein
MTAKRPFSITFISYLFLIAGVLSAYHLLLEILSGSRTLDIGFLFIFLGWGLLRLSPAAHTWALVVVILGWIMIAIVTVASGIFGAGVVHVGPNHRILTGWEKRFAVFGFALVCAAILVWFTRVLRKYESLFKKDDHVA